MHTLNTYSLTFDAIDSKCLLRLLYPSQSSLLVEKIFTTGLDNAAHHSTPGQVGHQGLGGKVTIVNFAKCGDWGGRGLEFEGVGIEEHQ